MITSKVCLIPQSIDFCTSTENVHLSLEKLKNLVSKVRSSFIEFVHSSDFNIVYNDIFNLQNHEQYDSGVFISILHDHIGTDEVQYTHDEIIKDSATDNIQYSVYRDLQNHGSPLPSYKFYVSNEKEVVDHAQNVLASNIYTNVEYALIFPSVYSNLIFHSDFSQLDSLSGGCRNFIKRISKCLNTMNFHLIEGTPQENIAKMKSQLDFPMTEEGGGKVRRQSGELKYNFNYMGESQLVNCEYHYKLERSDNDLNKYHSNRIYFGFVGKENKKIGIAHIGKHL